MLLHPIAHRSALFFFVISMVGLVGCAAGSLLPAGYEGPRSFVRESMKTYTEQPMEALKPFRVTKVDFFSVTSVNGQRVVNSRDLTASQNFGRGFQMSPVVVSHVFPSGTVTLGVIGTTHHPAPILAIIHGTTSVEGAIQFTAEPDTVYLVKGDLSADKVSVWLEEESTGRQIGQRIEGKTHPAVKADR